MKDSFAYILYIERDAEEHLVSLHRTLDESEDALRAYARTIFVRPSDDDIVETLAGDGIHPRIYACTMKRNGQVSSEIIPFARKAA